MEQTDDRQTRRPKQKVLTLYVCKPKNVQELKIARMKIKNF